jgi:hypothetical protein
MRLPATHACVGAHICICRSCVFVLTTTQVAQQQDGAMTCVDTVSTTGPMRRTAGELQLKLIMWLEAHFMKLGVFQRQLCHSRLGATIPLPHRRLR